MFALAARGAALIGRTHQTALRIDVLHGGLVVASLVGFVTAGTVSAAADRPIMRNLTLTMVDPDGSLSKTAVGELLSPYDAEIKPWRGVVIPAGVVDWVPMGVFRLTATDVGDSPDGLQVSLTGQDRAMIYQRPLPGPVTVSAGTAVETAVQNVLARVNGGLQFAPWSTGRTVGPLLYEADSQAWDVALTLAQSVGCWLFHDRDGVCRMQPYAGVANSSLAVFRGTVLDATRSEDADGIRNVVVVQSAESGAGKIVAVAEDTDPSSPTFAGGSYGRRQETITNPHVGTVAQALEVAQTELVKRLGRSRQVSWSCVPDPQTDPGDSVTVDVPRAGLVNERVVVAQVDLPLDVGSAMKVTARRSIITRGAL